MALELVKLDSGTLPGIAEAIREKRGGTDLMLPSEMRPAILAIPTGAALPELTTPAEVGHVVAGKEYIDAAGAKKAGTLVVCDTVQDDGYFGDNGYGLSVNLASGIDGSRKTLELPEPNLKSENIISGVSIFGVPGTAKTIEEITVTTACSVASEVANYFSSIAQENENAVFVFAKSISDDIPNNQTVFVPVYNKVIPGYYMIRYRDGQLNLTTKISDTNGCVLNVGDVYFKVVLDG